MTRATSWPTKRTRNSGPAAHQGEAQQGGSRAQSQQRRGLPGGWGVAGDARAARSRAARARCGREARACKGAGG